MSGNSNKTITVAVDFDGTCVTHEYPLVGSDIGAAEVLRKLVDKGHQLILFTMRSDGEVSNTSFGTPHGLTDAVNWFKKNDLPLFGIQTNPEQKSWTESPKAYAQMYIDDAALGCPLLYDANLSLRPFVDWKSVEKLLKAKELI